MAAVRADGAPAAAATTANDRHPSDASSDSRMQRPQRPSFELSAMSLLPDSRGAPVSLRALELATF